jgi:hypothetical protein
MQVTVCYLRLKASSRAARSPRNRLLLGFAALAAVTIAAGCGGGKSARPTTTIPPRTATAAPADPGRAVVEAFVAAARAGDAAAMWRMLSSSARERLGPSLGAFRHDQAATLRRSLDSLHTFKVIVSERITSEFGVVAIDDRRRVQAFALRLQGTRWRVELGSPVRIRLVGEPLAVQVAAAVEGPGGAGTAVMYVDGLTVNPEVAGSSRRSTIYANLDPGLDPGRHTLVVFASDGREASASAWAFTVTKR